MSKGNSYLFHGTLGTSVSGLPQPLESYTDRGVSIPPHIQAMLDKLPNKGDYIKGNGSDFDMRDVSVMSKETGVEFAKITIGNESYLIRGDKSETTIPDNLLNRMIRRGGSFDYHTHPHNDDLVPSKGDRDFMEILRISTGQQNSTIVTPNGRTLLYNENGVISTGTVPNIINDDLRKLYSTLFGGNS